MAHIRIDYDGLMQQVSSLNSQIEQYQTLGGRVNSLLAQMQSSWEGNACNSYISMMHGYMQKAEKMTAVLSAFKSYAEGAANDFTQTDRQCAEIIKSAF